MARRRRTAGRTGSAPALTDRAGAGGAQASLGLAASAASHMASTGGSRPVHSTSCAAAWCTSMPSPSSTVAPALGRHRQPARRAGRVDQVRRHLPGLEQLRAGRATRPGPRRRPGPPPAIPTGVALTTRSAADHGLGDGPVRQGHDGSHRARQGGRLVGPLGGPVHHGHLGRPGLGQGQHHRPGRPAGADDDAAPAARGRNRRHGAARTRSPRRRCWSPSSEPSRFTTQLTASEPARHFAALVDAGHDVGLVRHGDRQPRDAGPAHRLERAGRAARRAPRRRRNATRPEPECGERAWRAGAATRSARRGSR